MAVLALVTGLVVTALRAADTAPPATESAVAAPTARPAPHEFDPAGFRGTLILVGPEADPAAVRAALQADSLKQLDLVALGGVPMEIAVDVDGLPPVRHRLHSEHPDEWEGLLTSAELVIPPDQVAETALWIHAGNAVEAARVPWQALAVLVRSRLEHGGAVIAAGAVAMGLGEQFEAPSDSGVPWLTGSGVLPVRMLPAGAVSRGENDPADAAGRGFSNLETGSLGLCLNPTGLVQVRGRRVSVPKDSVAGATFILPATEVRPETLQHVTREQPADLTRLRRAALARARPPFPPATCPTPEVSHGTLLIVGGGGFSDSMVRLFVERAGGPSARIVVIPTANPEGAFNRSETARFERAGAGQVSVLHTRSRAMAGTPEFLAPLREATGVWLTGGRQWRLVDAYEGTPVVELCHAVLKRGGIIGGSSAGATIQGDFLVRGHPLGNEAMIAEGYEQGFAFLPGTAIDQHFSQRGREPDMLLLKRTFPQLVGIGIDEATAIVVSGTRADVIGAGAVRIYDRTEGAIPPTDPPPCVVLTEGESYDFRSRNVHPRPEQ